jgi:hypothetical protein
VNCIQREQPLRLLVRSGVQRLAAAGALTPVALTESLFVCVCYISFYNDQSLLCFLKEDNTVSHLGGAQDRGPKRESRPGFGATKNNTSNMKGT